MAECVKNGVFHVKQSAQKVTMRDHPRRGGVSPPAYTQFCVKMHVSRETKVAVRARESEMRENICFT